MKIDFSTVLNDLKGVPLKDGLPPAEGQEDKREELTLGSVVCSALLATYPDENNLDPKVKFQRFKLAEKASDGGEQELTVEDAAEIKKLLGKAWGPLVMGRAYEILDPPSEQCVAGSTAPPHVARHDRGQTKHHQRRSVGNEQ